MCNFTLTGFFEVIGFTHAYQPFAMRNAMAFSIHKDIGHSCSLSSEISAHNLLLFIVAQIVKPNQSKGRSVSHHVSVDYFTAFLAFEFLEVNLSSEEILAKLEVVAFLVAAKAH